MNLLLLISHHILSVFNHVDFLLWTKFDLVLRLLIRGEFALDQYWLDIERNFVLLISEPRPFDALLAPHILVTLLA